MRSLGNLGTEYQVSFIGRPIPKVVAGIVSAAGKSSVRHVTDRVLPESSAEGSIRVAA